MSSGGNQEEEYQQEAGASTLSPLIIIRRRRTNLHLWRTPFESVSRETDPTIHGRVVYEDIIHPPYPWATNHSFRIHSLEYLRFFEIRKITGDVYCIHCDTTDLVELDLESKYGEVRTYIIENKSSMHGYSPEKWRSPDLMDCRFCTRQKCVRAIIHYPYGVNWLFLLLSEMITFCSWQQVQDFCRYGCDFGTVYRGLKDRCVYLTYLGICKQLEPNGPFSP